MFNFYDIPVEAFPADAAYYFNVMLYLVPMADLEFDSYWNLERINDPRPMAFHFYKSDEQEIEVIMDAVVEVRPSGVGWYRTESEWEEIEFE